MPYNKFSQLILKGSYKCTVYKEQSVYGYCGLNSYFVFLSTAILVIYLTQMLKMDNDSATAIYHAFNMLCYFSPLFGAMLADSLLGKYK